jgi:hypothetical protein
MTDKCTKVICIKQHYSTASFVFDNNSVYLLPI